MMCIKSSYFLREGVGDGLTDKPKKKSGNGLIAKPVKG
jgi:hypothetical protein